LGITLNSKQELVFSPIGEMNNSCNEVFQENVTLIQPKIDFLKRNYHLAVTGKVFKVIYECYPDLFEKLLVCGIIFARMLPDQKTLLVEHLQKLGYGVGMCGDGANDCGALKRAQAGISLSETEASIASPFTSKISNISCVIDVIKEGRCALVTSFNIFKYMALYSMIQFCSVLLLYSISSNLGDLQYLYIDLFVITSFAVTLSRSAPAKEFTSERPLGRLVHPIVFFSLIGQILVQIGFQVFCFLYVQSLPSYKPITSFVSTDNIVCFENTVLFTFTSFQYIIVAVIFSAGKPFRQQFYSNLFFLLAIIFYMLWNTLFTVFPNQFFRKWLQILSIEDKNYYMVYFELLACNLLCSFIVDYVILKFEFVRQFLKSLLFKKHPRNRYKVIMKSLEADGNWPPKDIYQPNIEVVNIHC